MFTAVQVVHLLLYAGAVAGGMLILLAGARERRGDLEAARRLARHGGFAMAGCTLAAVPTGVAWLALLPAPVRERLLGADAAATIGLTLGSGLAVLAGFVGLLAGLSGKPRPGGWFAAALLAVALAVVLSAAAR